MNVPHAARAALLVLLVSTSCAHALAPARDAAPPPRPLAPVPGVLEYSGRLVARPIQPSDAPLRALGPADAAARARRARAGLAPVAIAHYPEVDEFVIPVPAGETEPQAIARMMATGDFQYVTPDWVCYPVDVPNDPLFPDQWHHATMDAARAWEVTTGSAAVVCAFVDTGIDLDHPDLAPLLVPGYNSVSGVPQASGGLVDDVNGHGTAVAGSAAAIGNNAQGVAGIGWNLRIMPVRTSDVPGGGAFMSDILAGARWAADHGAHVVSASYTGVADPSVGTTGAYIRAAGSIFCFAAGNDAADLPFDHPDVLVVAATAPDDTLAGFSARGQAIDVAAPGVSIWTTFNGGGYGPTGGTSLSTPIVNGVLGMIRSVNPDLTNDQAVAILLASCDDLGPPGEDDLFGHGRVNLFRAVRDAAATLGPSAPYAVPDRVTALHGTSRAIDVLANDFDATGDDFELVAFSPVSAAGGAVSLAPGAGPEGRDVLVFTPAAVGEDTFTYTIRDAAGLEDTAAVTVNVLDPAALRPADHPAATRPGLLARYYALVAPSSLPNFSALTPYASERLADVNIPSTEGPFAGSGRADDVGAVITGYFHAPEPDLYTFFTSSDDGSALWIGDVRIVDNDGLHGMQDRSGSIALHAGWHPIRIEFFEAGGGAGLIAGVQGGGLPRAVIPAALLRDSSCVGDWDDSGAVNSSDIAAFLSQWLLDVGAAPNPSAPADVNGDGVTNSNDISAFLSAWLAGVSGC